MFASVNGTAQSYGIAQDVPSRYILSHWPRGVAVPIPPLLSKSPVGRAGQQRGDGDPVLAQLFGQ
jgi:hypothetical protein